MYFWIAILSMFSWVFHILLYSKHARKIGGLNLAFYRSISLLFSMLPILYFADFSKIGLLFDYLPLLLLGGVSGGIAVIFYFESQKYLPVGVVTSLDRLATVIVVLLSYFFYGEVLTFVTYIGILLILVSAIGLSLVKNDMPHLDNNTVKGVLLVVPRIILVGVWFFVLGYVSREFDFALSSYFSEAFVLVGILLSYVIGKLFLKLKITKIDKKQFKSIFLISLLVLVGTGGYGLAVSLGGPLGVVSSIISSTIVFVSLIGHFTHNEKLNLKQWFFIISTFVGLLILKLNT